MLEQLKLSIRLRAARALGMLFNNEVKFESRNSCRWLGNSFERGNQCAAQAHGRSRRKADPLAYHEDVLGLRHSRIRGLPRL